MDLHDLIGDGRRLKRAWRGIDVQGITADSREVRPGFVFAALSGSKADGAAFIADACRRGAAAVIAGKGIAVPAEIKVPVISDANPRRALAFMAARFFPRQPETVAAVTGTNGKTSVAAFLRQIWEQAGLNAASIGTVGVVAGGKTVKLSHTTPDPVALHALLQGLADDGISHAAIEASSHGLAQHRLDAVRLKAVGFTNITRDHLDYHASFEDYLAQKLRLFAEVAPAGAVAVIDADHEQAQTIAAGARGHGLEVMTVGRKGEALKLASSAREGFSQILKIRHEGGQEQVTLPLAGDFQVSNALVAAGLAIACGMAEDKAIGALANLQGARGRLEWAGSSKDGAPVFIDYAHTPDALATVLRTLRPYAVKKLILVFGAGGDRDRGKRALMGKVAGDLADIAIVTDDNPRSEDPADIRAQILEAAPEAIEIGDRATAIAAGAAMLRAGDVLVVAGKGHETGQEIDGTIIPFDDHDAVRAALNGTRRRGRG